MTDTTSLATAAQNLIGKSISYCPESGNAMRFFQILDIGKVGRSQKTRHEYVVAELRDLSDNQIKVRTLLVGNIVSNHI